MSLIHIDILFNLGAMKDCIELGYRVLNVVTQENIPKLIPEGMDENVFMFRLYDTVGFVALANIISLTGSVKQFLSIIKQDIPPLPSSYGYFNQLEDLIFGRLKTVEKFDISPDDRFAPSISLILNAFVKCKRDIKAFSENIYKAKLCAKNQMLHKLEKFCDLMMAYICIMSDYSDKAEHIIVDIIQTGKNSGMSDIQMLAWYFMSSLYINEKHYDLAYGVINNALIFLEKNSFKNDYLAMLLKYNLYKVFTMKRDLEKAQICLGQATGISQKYGINIEFKQVEPPPEEEVTQTEIKESDYYDNEPDTDSDEDFQFEETASKP